MFEREHHRNVALVLQSLEPDVLAQRHCLFGGGTAMALRYGEYRESMTRLHGVDSPVTASCGRSRRRRGTGPLLRPGMRLELAREVRVDQYGIRTHVRLRFRHSSRYILEARIALAMPGRDDRICGLATLAPLDLAREAAGQCGPRADDSVSAATDDLAMQGGPQAP